MYAIDAVLALLDPSAVPAQPVAAPAPVDVDLAPDRAPEPEAEAEAVLAPAAPAEPAREAEPEPDDTHSLNETHASEPEVLVSPDAVVPGCPEDDDPGRPPYVGPKAPADLNETDARAWYKARTVAGDCLFALREGRAVPLPADLTQRYWWLLNEVEGRKETPRAREYAEHLRDCVRAWLAGDAYVLGPCPDSKPVAKRRACPHCGGAL